MSSSTDTRINLEFAVHMALEEGDTRAEVENAVAEFIETWEEEQAEEAQS